MSGLRSNYEKVIDLRRREQKRSDSKEKLVKEISQRFTTFFIGSLASIEDKFGKLWGHGLKHSEKTEYQKKMTVFWKQLREDILNKGNDQLRRMTEELKNYTVEYNEPVNVFRSTIDESEGD